jgi:hypothetical protein
MSIFVTATVRTSNTKLVMLFIVCSEYSTFPLKMSEDLTIKMHTYEYYMLLHMGMNLPSHRKVKSMEYREESPEENI